MAMAAEKSRAVRMLATLAVWASCAALAGGLLLGRPRRSDGLLNEMTCRKQVPGVENLVDGCACRVPQESGQAPPGGWRVELPPGVALKEAGKKGVGLFATRSFKKGEEVGRAAFHVMPCHDIQVGTPLGQRTVACETHFYDLQCGKLQGLDLNLLAASKRQGNATAGSKLAEALSTARKAAVEEAEGAKEEVGIFPEWLVFLNHAEDGKEEASTYYGPALYGRAAESGAVNAGKWVLVARKNIRANQELTINYQRGDWAFEALSKAFGDKSFD